MLTFVAIVNRMVKRKQLSMQLLDDYLRGREKGEYLFPNAYDEPANLDYLSCKVISAILKEHGPAWHGWHAFRRGLATNMHELGIPDIVIQAILRHSSVSVT
jgi:integrase